MIDRRYVALDRDGTIIIERNYLSDPEQVELIPGAAQGLRKLQELGFGLIVVTNQSGVSRGFFSYEQLERVHQRLLTLLAAEGVSLQGIYVCPHAPEDACGCRKPRPGLLQRAAAELKFNLSDCVVVGDKACDVDLGRNVNATSILVRTGYGAALADSGAARPRHTVDDLLAAADLIASQLTVLACDRRGSHRRGLTAD